MDEGAHTAAEPSPIPWQLEVSLLVPVVFVVLWFVVRVVQGAWADAKAPESALRGPPPSVDPPPRDRRQGEDPGAIR